jgi:hypothetical protein
VNPVKKLMSWLRAPSDPESVAEAQRLREERDMIRISQNTPSSQLGTPTNMAPTPDVLHPGSDDSHNDRRGRGAGLYAERKRF